jgi:hypothetical protein
MDIVEGFLFLLIAIEVLGGLVGFGVLSIVHVVIRWTRRRSVNLLILGIGMLLSGVYIGRLDAPIMITLSLFVSVPLAALVPLTLSPVRDVNITPLVRIVPCYLVVWAVGAILPFALVASGLFMIPFIYWHTPFSNAVIYVVLMLVYIGIATLVYRLMKMGRV